MRGTSPAHRSSALRGKKVSPDSVAIQTEESKRRTNLQTCPEYQSRAPRFTRREVYLAWAKTRGALWGRWRWLQSLQLCKRYFCSRRKLISDRARGSQHLPKVISHSSKIPL